MDPQAIFTELMSDYQNLPYAELGVATAIQRAAVLVHQTNHWQARGPLFYSDHLLLQRVYEAVDGSIDGLAEKAVGLGDASLVDALTQSNQINALVECFKTHEGAEDGITCSATVVAQCTALLTLCRSSLEQNGTLTNGLDNMLQGILDKNEELGYLFKQRLAV